MEFQCSVISWTTSIAVVFVVPGSSFLEWVHSLVLGRRVLLGAESSELQDIVKKLFFFFLFVLILKGVQLLNRYH